jgi:hypothetical protein
VTADIDTDGNLAVRNRESFVRVLIALCALGIIAAWMFSPAARVAAGWTGVCLVFGFALLAANESSDFIFVRDTRVVRWSRETPFRREGGTVPFDQVTGLSIERDFGKVSKRGGASRVVLLTATGPIPLTKSFTGGGSRMRAAERTLEYLLDACPQPELTWYPG